MKQILWEMINKKNLNSSNDLCSSSSSVLFNWNQFVVAFSYSIQLAFLERNDDEQWIHWLIPSIWHIIVSSENCVKKWENRRRKKKHRMTVWVSLPLNRMILGIRSFYLCIACVHGECATATTTHRSLCDSNSCNKTASSYGWHSVQHWISPASHSQSPSSERLYIFSYL